MLVHLFNANGLAGKAEEICQFNSQVQVDLSFIVETWLSPAASVPFRPHIANLMTENLQDTLGGRRSTGGILVFGKRSLHQNQYRVLFEDKDSCFIALEVVDVILIGCYVSPSQPEEKLTQILTKAEELSAGFTKNCVVFGDLNARMGEVTGDSMTNSRGRRLLGELENTPLTVQQPNQGKWTTFAGAGCGVTDVVLANFEVSDLTVHEHNSLGGSDHRPVTFRLNVEAPAHSGRSFERWNVRKLVHQPVKEQYASHLQTSLPPLLGSLQQVRNRLQQGSSPQPLVDEAWSLLKSWMEAAAMLSVGRLVLQDHAPSEFWTEELTATRNEIQQEQEAVQDLITDRENSGVSREEILARAKALTQSQRIYRVSIQQRRKVLFENAVDELAMPQNLGAFLRMTKGAQSRRNKKGCKLDPSAIDTHALHFLGTFGGEPAGQPPVSAATPVDLAHFQDTEELLDYPQVHKVLMGLPLGKAAGPDGIPAELLIYGGSAMLQALVVLLQLVHSSFTVPTEWQQALIVPVFKNKGSDSDISNYRPIALTCTTRRLYERLLLCEFSTAIARLDESQAGFRARRSTLDQAMVLHETLNDNAKAFAVLLDFRAAYDLVDRRILWHELRHYFGFPVSAVQRLQNLFDHTTSKLVVSGKFSQPIQNKRGLLQGSSLSPILFNFFIDGMCRQLRRAEMPSLEVHGVRVNRLLFADDAALVATSVPNMAKLLKVCEEWSLAVGMEFAPAKCVVLGPAVGSRQVPLKLYGQDLESQEKVTYLGFPFVKKGICFKSLATERAKKARGVIAMLAPLGMNAQGWAPSASIQIYKSFIRPVLEYGLALHQPKVGVLKLYDQVQTLALRTLTSTPRNTSRAGLLRLLQVEPISHRAQELNLQWAARLNNSSDATNLAVRVFHQGLERGRGLKGTSLPRRASENALWNHPEAKMDRPRLCFGAVEAPPAPLSAKVKRELRKAAIVQLESGTEGIAGAIEVQMTDPLRPFLKPNVGITRRERWVILQWTLGAVTRHEPCYKCRETLTRTHAAECSGAAAFLQAQHNDIPAPVHDKHTVIGAFLNKIRNQVPSSSNCYKDAVTAIQMVLTECRGYVQQGGLWVNANAIAIANDSNSGEEGTGLRRPVIAQPPPRTARSLAISARNAAIAAARNRPLGRPPRQASQASDGIG